MEKQKLMTAYYQDEQGSSIAVNVFATEDEDMYLVLVDRHPVRTSRIEIVDKFEILAKDIDRLIEQYDKEYKRRD